MKANNQNGIFFGGRRRLLEEHRKEIEKIISEKYSSQIIKAGFFKKMIIKIKIFREMEKEMKKASKQISKDTIF